MTKILKYKNDCVFMLYDGILSIDKYNFKKYRNELPEIKQFLNNSFNLDLSYFQNTFIQYDKVYMLKNRERINEFVLKFIEQFKDTFPIYKKVKIETYLESFNSNFIFNIHGLIYIVKDKLIDYHNIFFDGIDLNYIRKYNKPYKETEFFLIYKEPKIRLERFLIDNQLTSSQLNNIKNIFDRDNKFNNIYYFSPSVAADYIINEHNEVCIFPPVYRTSKKNNLLNFIGYYLKKSLDIKVICKKDIYKEVYNFLKQTGTICDSQKISFCENNIIN